MNKQEHEALVDLLIKTMVASLRAGFSAYSVQLTGKQDDPGEPPCEAREELKKRARALAVSVFGEPQEW